MKAKIMVLFFVVTGLILLGGCTLSQPEQNASTPPLQRQISPENTGENTENAAATLDELRVQYNQVNENLSNCLEEKETCKTSLANPDCNCPEVDCDCPVCPVSADCNAVAASLSSQLTTCIEAKAGVQNQFNDCNAMKETLLGEKNSCLSDLEAANAALAEPLSLSIHHYVKGNLFESGGYRKIQAFVGSNVKKVFFGLDYTGGTDSFFSPGVSTTYGLNLVRWYVLTRTDAGTYEPKILNGIYESDAGDTVLIEETESGVSYLKIKSTEFDAGTSKEGVSLRRITVLYIES
ncbi:MAG: hypothetical protein V1777_01680 [Candidatus Micrarchaeota archaeon]